MRICITGHRNLGNRGCEALLRATVALFRSRFPQARFRVPSTGMQADRAQWPQAEDWGVELVPAHPLPPRFIQWARVVKALPPVAGLAWPTLPQAEADRMLQDCDLLLSIGGDNYSLDYDLASLAYFAACAEAAASRGLPTVLWGASIGPFEARPAVERHMRQHFRQWRGITVRESLSHQGLQRLQGPAQGGPEPEVLSVADPAFVLQAEAVDLSPWIPEGEGPLLGLNLSTLLAASAGHAVTPQDRRRLIEDAAAFVNARVREGVRVLCVPHVSAATAHAEWTHAIAASSDDGLLLRDILTHAGSPASARSVPAAWNAAQLKSAIAACDGFIGARTHATIAAMSSGVPTVSLAYSRKAHGIHADLLGDERSVVDGRQRLSEALDAAWIGLQSNGQAWRSRLHAQLPRWRTRAAAGLDLHVLNDGQSR